MIRRSGFWFGNLIFSLSVLALAGGAVMYRQQIADWWTLRQYQPSAEIVQLAESTTMQHKGRDLFYVSDPVIQDKQAFNISCHNSINEASIVLGCYKAQHIYIYNITDPRLAGIEEVTAAHEMLHAAYDRLSAKEAQRVDALLDVAIAANNDERIDGLIDLYNKQEPGHIYNEMHSIFGTEVADLSPDLEEYYSQYFSDRHKVVAYSQDYERVFSESRQIITDLKTQLSGLKITIDANNATLQQQESNITAKSDYMRELRSGGDIAAYNAEVPGYNASVRQFNELIGQTRAAVDQYNQLVATYNDQVAAQSDLYENIDSNYQPAAQTN